MRHPNGRLVQPRPITVYFVRHKNDSGAVCDGTGHGYKVLAVSQ